METLAVERTVWIAAPPTRVWRALTDQEQLGKWWPPDEWSIRDLQIGGKVAFGNEPDAAYATIEILDPPKQLMLRWEPNPKFPVTTMSTLFVLAEENGGTRLTVTESGFESLPDDVRQTRLDETSKGYTMVLNDLKVLLERQ
jgi:uncharacterized protein YndB with AHSA1/START domain